MLITLIIFLCSVYFLWKQLLNRDPVLIDNLQAQISNQIVQLRLDIQRIYAFVWTLWFPSVTRTAAVQLEDNTLSIQHRTEETDPEPLLQVGTASLQTKIVSLDMAAILDDHHLDKLLCSQCNKYLSVLPIRVYPNDVVKCGRCCKENDGSTGSLYEKLIQNCLFKCVNRYEHCNKLLTIYEVIDHEKQCFSSSYDCPKCDTKFSSSAYELVNHFKNRHPTSILDSNKFYIQLKGMPFYKERYLYLRNDLIFFVLVENLYGAKLCLSVVSLTPENNITQQFNLKFLGGTIEEFKTDVKMCSSLKSFDCDYFQIAIENADHGKVKCKVSIHIPEDARKAYEIPSLFKKPEEIPVEAKSVQTISLEQIVGVELTDQFKQEYPSYRLTSCGTALYEPGGTRIDLVCSECQYFTGKNVFSCVYDKHVMCWDCRTKRCKCNALMGGWNANLASVNELLLLPCRWNCRQTFSGDALRNHESQCVYNLNFNYRR